MTFAGTARGIEARVVPREGFELDLLRSAGLKGSRSRRWLRGLSLLPLERPRRVADHLAPRSRIW